MIYPGIEDFKKLARQYNIIPVYQEFRADTSTPISLFYSAAARKGSFLLESVEKGENLGRYSIMGRDPFIEIKAYGEEVTFILPETSFIKTGNPVEIIENYFSRFKGPQLAGLPPFCGGAMGYFAYDAVRYMEKLPVDTVDSLHIPDIYLFIFKSIVVYDHTENKTIFIVNARQEAASDPERIYKESVQELDKMIAQYQPSSLDTEYEPSHKEQTDHRDTLYGMQPEEYCQQVVRAKKYIKSGDIFQVVLSQRIEADTDLPALELYRRLRHSNPSPYMFFLNLGSFQVIGSSPETLVKVKNRIVETCPIAGTRPRGATPEADGSLAAELLNDPKERAEHIMLLDLGRNDIGRVAEIGSIKLSEYMQIEKYSQVMHIVSRVKGALQKDLSVFDALRACFPAGTVSGAPKVRAMEIIEELEKERRGLYAGAVGYISFSGDMDLCIAIRTILLKNQKAYIQTGAGIVADSEPEKEYQETLRKAAALLRIL